MAIHQYLNFQKMSEISMASWYTADKHGLLNINARYLDANWLETPQGHRFINMCSCSYLGLDTHKAILKAAAREIITAKTLEIVTARVRIHLTALKEAEEQLAELFFTPLVIAASCSILSQHILPLLACGALTENHPPLMVFDKQAHFSMNINKAICGDETEVITCPHNDMDFLEDQCKKNNKVAYIADGAYSMGGHAPMKELVELQNKYGLFLYIDDSHSLSAYGEKGWGYAHSFIKNMSDKTIIVASLSKAFGSGGGVAMLGSKTQEKLVRCFTGPLLWSQNANTAMLGAIKESIKIHLSPELTKLQTRLRNNIAYFDQLFPTEFSGTPLPIRIIPLNFSDRALACSKQIYNQGYYTSAVFFPIVPKDKAALRIMLRANMSKKMIKHFTDTVLQTINSIH